METMIIGNELWQLIMQSDTITKVVYGILVFMSVLCWTVFLGKSLLFLVKRRSLYRCLHQMDRQESLEAIFDIGVLYSHNFAGYVISCYSSIIKTIIPQQKGFISVYTDQSNIQVMQEHIQLTSDDIMEQEGSFVSVLSICSAVAPLLGLFGTVWGLIHAFLRINEKQGADIATVAPGIAEALLTTLAGLVVAIPALIMFNCMQLQLRTIERYMGQISQKISLLIQKQVAPSGGDVYAPIEQTVSSKQTDAY